MVTCQKGGEMKSSRIIISKTGYALLTAIIAINIFALLVLKARAIWETELQRDLEEELIFRGRQYVTALDWYMKKNANIPLQKLDDLVEKKFLRKRYKDPITNLNKWYIVMRSGISEKNKLLVVPEEMLPQYITQATIIGVASTSREEGFKVYRKKKKYCEWAFYIGEQANKEMPELKFVDGSNKSDSNDNKDNEDTTVDESQKGEQRREEPTEEEERKNNESESGREKPGQSRESETRNIEPE
jgi:hypothetical protein